MIILILCLLFLFLKSFYRPRTPKLQTERITVYQETDDVGQDAISVLWAVSEKVKSGKPVIKPH